MSSREKILESLEKNKPKESPLPALPDSGISLADPVEKFRTILESIGANISRRKRVGLTGFLN